MKNIWRKHLRFFVAILISLVPLNVVRCFFYRILFGYEISNSNIGWFAIVDVAQFSVTNSTIGRINVFRGPMHVLIKNDVQIGFRNRFNCGFWVGEKQEYSKVFIIEEDVLITNAHHFDVAGEISIGSRTVIAGMGSQFWTHGNGVIDRDIIIGSDCYIGTSVIFCPGTSIANHTVVGAGTVITKKFSEESVLIVGNDGKIKRQLS